MEILGRTKYMVLKVTVVQVQLFCTMAKRNKSLNRYHTKNHSSSECNIDQIHASSHLLIILINIFHITILKNLKHSNTTLRVTQIILLISIDDIAYSSLTVLWSLCIRQWLKNNQSCVDGIIESVWTMTGLLKYFCLL